VHITEETLKHLNGEYQVEEGDGGSRDALLQGRKTYLVIDPKKRKTPRRSLGVGSYEDVFPPAGTLPWNWEPSEELGAFPSREPGSKLSSWDLFYLPKKSLLGGRYFTSSGTLGELEALNISDKQSVQTQILSSVD